jgi:hypothetical protein
MLEVKTTKVQFPDSEVKSPYYEVFLQGATLVPRNLCFVRPEGLSSSPAVETDPEVDRDAKEPWKGIHLSGLVYDDYLYATLLSKHLLPFGYQKLHLVALPAILNDDAKPRMIAQKDFTTQGHIPVFNRWFEPVYRKWDELKKESVSESLPEWLNYRNKLVSQKVTDTVKILHNKSGTHISACVIDTRADQIHVYQKRVNGLVTESTTYAYDARSLDEAHYLCALLNAPCVNNAIKPHQPRGLGGERDIHRRAFEACTIPLFDLDDPDHQELASLSWEAHQRIDELKQMEHEKILRGYITTARKAAREATKEQISAIDEIARRILKL